MATRPEHLTAYRREGGVALIEMRLTSVRQLFNSLDPAPFPEKDLDREAEAYIVDSVREFPIDAPLKLVFHLPREEMEAARDLASSIHNYFAYRLRMTSRDLTFLLRQGRLTLLIAIAFLLACLSLRQLVLSFDDSAFGHVLAEGLLITGWVAMWRPIEILLYEWWPIRRRCRVAEKLTTMPVEVRTLDA
ncbi:MAG: hypothetical protein U1F33_02575 [Alphaproteobacteria bacterium]